MIVNCVICQDGGKDIGMVKVGEKELGTLLEYCKRRGDLNLESYPNLSKVPLKLIS